jgi:hypothetical protein
MPVNAVHLTSKGLIPNQVLVVPEDISLCLVCSQRMPWVIAVIHNTVVITPNARSHRRTNILPFAGRSNQKLQNNATQYFGSVVIGRETIASFSPGDGGSLSGD